MAGNTRTPRVNIPWTNVVTGISPEFPGGADRDVVRRNTDTLKLVFGLTVDTSIWNEPIYELLANFQVTQVATGERRNNYWNIPVQIVPKVGSLLVWFQWTRAHEAGVVYALTGHYRGGDGLYLYRPSFTVLINEFPWRDEIHIFEPAAKSEFAVGEEHFILLENSVRAHSASEAGF